MDVSKEILEWFKTPRVIFLVLCLGVVIYANSLGNGFVGDDPAQIVSNIPIHSIVNIPSFFAGGTFNAGSKLIGNYYKPILTSAFALVYSIFGANPTVFHLLQLFIHTVNTVLIFLIAKYFFRKEIALGIALIFLSHPINNEAIVYISGLQEPLFLLFGLLAFKLVQKKETIKITRHAGIILLLLLTLLSKETGIVFLIINPIFQKLFQNKWREGIIQSTAAFSIYLLLRLGIAGIYLNQNFVFPTTKLTILEKMTNLPQLVFFYLKTFFYPKDLLFAQSWLVKAVDFPNFYLPLFIDLVFLTSIIFFVIYLYRKNLKHFKIFVLFFIWFILGLGIHSQLIPLDQTVADRWFYFLIIGLLGMFGVLIDLLDFNKVRSEWIYLSLLFSIVCLFSVRDMIRNTNWSAPITLYQHDLQINPDNYQLQNALGYELMNTGKLDDAKYHITLSINQYPTYTNWDSLGEIYTKSNKFPEAKAAYNTALTYWADDNVAYEGLSSVMVADDDLHVATSFIKTKALTKYPNDPLLWLYLAIAEYELGNKNEALQDAVHSNQIVPSNESVEVYNAILNDQKQVFKRLNSK